MSLRFRLAAAILPVLCLISLLNAGAQTPVALPTTMTTLNSSSAAAARGGMIVDASGNVFIADDASSKIYMVNQSAGMTTTFIGSSTANCTVGVLSSSGDGCTFANTKPAISARGIGIDPYGNVLIPGYGDNMVHILCRATSPLCTAGTPSPSALSPIQIPVGTMGLVAGCTVGAGATKASGTDNAPAFMTASSTYSTSTFYSTSACATTGTTYSPYGATGDAYGNIYYAEIAASTATERYRVVVGPATYNGIANPIYAALAKNTAWSTITPGYVYTVGVGNTGTTTKGSACTTTTAGWVTAGTATDAYGDGCLFTSSENPSSTGYVGAVVVDAAGNMIYLDEGRGLRVFYVSDGTNFAVGSVGYKAGQAMKNAIYVNNKSYTGFTAAISGYTYILAGTGATAISTTPTLGSNTTVSSTSARRIAISPQGNVYIGVYNASSTSDIIYFYDMNTGYIRILLNGGTNPAAAGSYCTGTSGAKAIDTFGDGCPVGATSGTSYASFGNSNSMLPLAVDAQGNIYIYDSVTSASNTLVRKILAQGMAPQTLNSAQTQTVKLHFPETETIGASLTPTFALTSNGDMAASATVTPLCAQTADLSVDCTVGVTTTPSAAGQRSAGLTLTLPAVSSGSWDNGSATIQLGGTVTGSVLALDSASTMVGSTPTAVLPTTNAIFSAITPVGVAVDGAGNVYTMDSAHSKILESIAGTTYTLATSLPTTPSQIAVDQTGNVFAVGIGTASIKELAVASAGAPSSYTSTTITYTPTSGTAAPQGIAVDQIGNLYVADKTTGSIYRITPSAGPLQNQITVATGFSNPSSLAVDGFGNVYVSDPGAGAVYKLTPGLTGTYTQTSVAGVSAGALAVDAAGDLYVQSGTTVLEVPVSGPASVTVLTGLNTPDGLAVDGKGMVYSADSHNTSITQVVRSAVSYAFPNETTFFNGILTDAGNQATTASTALSNVSLVGGSANPCAATASILGTVTAGQACSISTNLIGVAAVITPITNTLTLIPAATTTGSVTFTGNLPVGVVVPTTTTVGAPTGTLLYSPSGTEATFVVTVAATALPPGSVNVTVDSTTTTYPLTASGTNGVTTVTVSGLAAGNHTISAAYLTNSNYTGSNSLPAQSFSIAKVATAVSWTPTAITQQISAAIGTGVLNATATPSVAGNFTYTATPSGGSAGAIDASTYLGIGTYSLAVTFTPNDLVDYLTSTGSVASYTVTKASTTASVGATTNLVAADGTGNYTSLSTALAALPVTGGTLYLKPGTYTGQNAISYPNVSLRGLGGDPTQVILTAEDGAFSSPFTGYLGTGPGSGNAAASGDQGSTTLDVTKSAYMGTTLGTTQYTPNNFFAEYLTIQNTYNTSTTTTTTYSTTTGSCASGATAHTLQYWYNAGLQCSSQALALWIESDQAVLNNVNLTSQQDTLYAGSQGCGSFCTVARQYFWKGLITGDVDYLFGDAATVFDHTNIFTTWHGATATGTETIEAQNKKFQTGSASDYLSGYVCNSCTLMSQSTGMTALYYGRPYGPYSTWIMLNNNVDQVSAVGWIEFSGDTNLPTSTYAEFNTSAYTDPAVGTSPYPASIFGGSLIPTGGNTGTGVSGTREVTSVDPGTIEASNALKTQLTAAQAAQYYPVNFLGATVSSNTLSAGQSTNWNPVTALAARVNSFASTGASISVASGSSVTILGRPQTPGAGLIPTGTYSFMDGSTSIASGTLDASGEASLTTSSLTAGTHLITMVYGGDSNFAGSTSAAPFLVAVSGGATQTPNVTITPSANATYGSAVTAMVSVAPNSGTTVPTGTVLFSLDGGTAQTVTLTNGAYTFTYPALAAGTHTLSALYEGDANFLGTTATGYVNVARVLLQVRANNATMVVGASLPSLTYAITGFVSPDTQASATTGAPSLTTAATGAAVGAYPITVSTGTLASRNYTFAFTNGTLYVQQAAQAAAVATGDTRSVSEPVIPATCTQLMAALTSVNDDLPASVDAAGTPAVTNPDGARIQAALNSCSASYPGTGAGLAVRLSIDGAGHNAYLTGPISMPSNVTLVLDPGVYVYFSRNAQDYDKVSGTHTCGNMVPTGQPNASATSNCKPLIEILGNSSVGGASTNVGIMGFGKFDGRGGDPLLNAIAPYAGYSWWALSSAANGAGSQENPRFLQVDSGSSNITLYKITLRNSPLFHISTTGAVSGFTAWDIKIVTPTTSRNTDGIDPGNAQNFTITNSWVSDGDDNIAVGAAGTTAPAANISITNNHFFAGHGESIGSYTGAGVSNILFDNNMLSGNAAVDGNSTGLRLKSGYDRGGLVTGIQFSNSCFQNHKADIIYSPNYENTTGTLLPNFTNILMQNLTFLPESAVNATLGGTSGSIGTQQYTGTSSNGTVYPLGVTFDNVTFASTLATSSFSPSPTNTALSYGPGQVSSNFITDYATFVGANGNTVANNITAASLLAPSCNFPAIAAELTGPTGLPQTITAGQTATAIVLLSPAVGGAVYPTGTVTLTDALTSNSTTVTLTGTTDIISIPLSGLAVGTHTFTATYSGDATYVPSSGSIYTTVGPYVITVNAGSLAATTTTLSGVPSSSPYGSAFTATATVTGNNPTGSVQFLVNGVVYATSTMTSGVATASINLAFSTTAYSITAIYSGDNANAASTSSASSLTVSPALTTTALSAGSTTSMLGHPVLLLGTVATQQAGVGTPTGTVNFTYTNATAGVTTATNIASSTLVNGVAAAAVDLPVGANIVTASYPTSSSFSASTSTTLTVTVGTATIVPLPSNPFALPYTMTTIAGGAVSGNNTKCAGSTDAYGDGCQATAVNFATDLRTTTADPFGNVYFTDQASNLIRRIAPNGIITAFAGKVSGTACIPPAFIGAVAGSGCTPTLVTLSNPRGVRADAAGNVYIAGYSQNKIYVVSVADGLMYVVAGTGSATASGTSNGDGGSAVSATFVSPRGVAVDSLGYVYIADTGAFRIRKVDTYGNIQTIVGTGTAGPSGNGGPATSALLSSTAQDVLTDANLNVYIADNSQVRVVCVTCGTNSPLDHVLNALGIASPQNGSIYGLAGGAAAAYTGTFPTLATNIALGAQKLAMDNNGNLYISDGSSSASSTGAIWFLDMHTGFIRPIAGDTTANCSTATDSFGDGCHATQAAIGVSGSLGFGVGADPLGNIYISDTKNAVIRKVVTGLASPSTATATTFAAPVQLHFVAGDTVATSNALAYSSSEWTLGTPACSVNADNTADCLLTSTFDPAVPGLRTTPLTVTSSLGSISNLSLEGIGQGAGTTVDPASQISFGKNLIVVGLATDNAGNVYVSDATSKKLLRFASSAVTQGASATSTTLATLTAPGAVAVDPRGFVYVADTSTGLITMVSPSGAVSTLPFTFTTPVGLATDGLSNLYVSDSTALAVYQINTITGVRRTLNLGAIPTPAGLTIDPSGNLLVAFPSVPAVYRFSASGLGGGTVTSTAVAPTSVVSDAAGNLLIADTAKILAVPASSNSTGFTVASLTPSALAIDAVGNLYTGSNGGVLKLIRTQGTVKFTGPSAAAQTISILDSGNQPFSLTSVSQTDAADYTLGASSTTDCNVIGSGVATLAVGGVCSINASYTATTYVPTSDTVTLSGNQANAALSIPSTVQFVLAGPTVTPTATVTLNPTVPASPVFGQSVSVSANVVGANGATLLPTGSIVFTVDGSPMASIALTNGMASTTLTGLSTSTHTVTAAYTSTNGYATASSTTSNIVVGKASQAIAYAPSVTAYTYSPTGSFSLSATATSGLTVSFASTTSSVCTVTGTTATILTAGTCTIQATQAGSVNYLAAAVVSVNYAIGQSSQTITYAPSVTTYTYSPTGTISLSATATSGLTVSFASTTTGVCTVSGTTATILTAGTCTIQATQAGNGNYLAATTVPVSYTIGQSSQTITYAPSVKSYAYSLGGTFSLSATSTSGLTVGFASTTTGVCTVSGTTATIVSGGTCTIQATQAGNGNYLAATPVPVSYTIGIATPTVVVTSSLNPVLLQNAVTLTATVSSKVGSPTGTVTFLDGTTNIGTGTLVSGVATLTTSTLALGAHSITIVYSGDTNFATGTSAVLTQTVLTISLGTPGSGTGGNGTGTGTTQTVTPGETASYLLPIAPNSGTTFPLALTLTVTGMPTGATATIAPSSWVQSTTLAWTWTLPANTALTGGTQLNIQIPQTTASAQPAGMRGGKFASQAAPFMLALLLLPFAGKLRRAGKRFGRTLSVFLLLAAGMAAMAGLSGCGSTSGYFTQAQQSYPITVTVTSGSLSQSTTVTLTVE